MTSTSSRTRTDYNKLLLRLHGYFIGKESGFQEDPSVAYIIICLGFFLKQLRVLISLGK